MLTKKQRLALALRISIFLIGGVGISYYLIAAKSSDILFYFTIQSNFLVFVFYLFSLKRTFQTRNNPQIDWDYLPLFRGFITLMITITGVVFAVILAPIISRMDPASLGDFIGDRSPIKLFFSAMLHYYIPFAVIVDWVFFAKKKQYRIKATIIWFVYPFSYIIMVYIRASIVGPVLSQYIYPFFNPTTMGKWLIPFILLLWVFFTGVSFLYVYLDQKLNEKTSI